MTEPIKPPPPLEPIAADTYDAALFKRMCDLVDQHRVSFRELIVKTRRIP